MSSASTISTNRGREITMPKLTKQEFMELFNRDAYYTGDDGVRYYGGF